jgi:hypothetical protein
MASWALNTPNVWLLFQPDLLNHCRTGLGNRGSAEIRNQVSADLWDEADTIDLAHALADYYGRKVVVVWTDDKEVVVEPRAKRRLDN